MQLSHITVFSKGAPLLVSGWVFRERFITFNLPESGNIFRTSKVYLPAKVDANQTVHDSFLYTHKTTSGVIGLLYSEKEPEVNKRNISLLIVANGNVDVSKYRRPDVKIKLKKHIGGAVKDLDTVMLVVTFCKRKGLTFTVKEGRIIKTIRLEWDKKSQGLKARQTTNRLDLFIARIRKFLCPSARPQSK